MFEALRQYLEGNWLLAISTPIYTVLIVLEVFLSQSRRLNFYSFRETLINFWLNIANTMLGLAIKGAVLLFMGIIYQYHLVQWDEGALYWAMLFLGLDLCFYIEHRCEHYSRILWAVHVTHHSSVEFNLTTGFRSSVFRPFISFFFFIPLVFLGFHPMHILLMDAICQIYGIIVHTRFVKKMPLWFEYVFVSPSHHRVHHASNVIYLDKNMGMVLIIWDRLFGTFQEELNTVVPVYGLTKNPEHRHHPLWIIFHEWIDLGKALSKPQSWLNRLKTLLMPPGWSADGSTKTSKQLRKAMHSEIIHPESK